MKYSSCILISIFINQWIIAVEPVAIISKSRGVVKHKLVSEIKYGSNAGLNTPLFSDSQIKTKKGAFTKIVYLDDGSVISIYPDTEVKVQGTIINRNILKQVELIKGIIRVNISNQTSGEFKLVTPFSELNCKECDFWVILNKLDGDQFIRESGNAQLLNLSVNNTMELISDSTIISKENIGFEIITTPATDIKFLESLMLDVDEKIHHYKKEHPEKQSTEININKVVIKLKNSFNIEREMIITFTQ